MGFLGVYKALYDYSPQSEGELALVEGDLLCILEKSTEDAWWKAKKKAGPDEEEEPEGLIPNTYIEEVQPLKQARALYEYTRQSDEELSFPEDAQLDIYDLSDPDWMLAGYDDDFGFVPSNYIELHDGPAQEDDEPAAAPRPPALPARSPAVPSASSPVPEDVSPEEPSSAAVGAGAAVGATAAAAALAGVLAGGAASSSSAANDRAAAPPLALPPRPQYTSDGTDDEDDGRSPPLPARPGGQAMRPMDEPSPQSPPLPQRTVHVPVHYGVDHDVSQQPQLSPGGFRMYNINEMVSVLGKRKKMPTTLGINLKTGMILIAPERAQDGPSREWSADKMTHYSREGKHVFLELVRPSRSVDFHAGAKDTAEEIVSALGELSGAIKAEGLREVIMAAAGREQKKGVVLYDFMAQGDDEVTVGVGDEVLVLDDTKSEEWWQVRRLKNGREGVVPSSYIEITGTVRAPQSAAATGVNAGKSTVAQNRLEEERLTKEAVRAAMKDESRRHSEVGPGMRLPERHSSLSARNTSSNSSGQGHQQQRSGAGKRENGRSDAAGSRSGKSKPDASKVRSWTDRTKSFSVEAQYLGIKDGKINLHKMNGVKIAVPIAKMSVEDLEYVERVEGISLDEDKPLSSVKRAVVSSSRSGNSGGAKVGASIEQPKKPEYDWFPFFLSCDVAPGLCDRYAQAFSKDSMDESVLPDVDATVLRTLGLREGDIIKVMRFLDNKYGRNRKKGEDGADADGQGGLFSGPGGALRNNTRRGRPAPTSATSDVIDPKAFSKQGTGSSDADNKSSPAPAVTSPVSATSSGRVMGPGGFDDDAWDVKPSTKQPAAEAPAAAAARPAEPTPAPAPAPVAAPAAVAAPKPLTGSMQDLSLLTQPLQPEKTAAPPMQTPVQQQPPAIQPQPMPQPQGATPSFFTGIAQQQTGMPAVNGQQQQQSFARARPMAPQYTQGQGGLMPPPPARPLSAPQSAQPSAFTPPPLQPQMTGHIAPPGQSLNEINQARMQQQYAQQMQQQQQQLNAMQGFQPQQPQQQQAQPLMSYPTGMQPAGMPFGGPGMMGMNGPQQQQQQPQQSPFADPGRAPQFQPSIQMQPTGFLPGPGAFNPGQQQQFGPVGGGGAGGVNSFLPTALEPQRTGIMMGAPLQPQATGMHFTHGFGNSVQNQPQQQQPQIMAPLQPQKTGPAPPVRFGVNPDAKRLAPQPTGRKANLSAATPSNPFGF